MLGGDFNDIFFDSDKIGGSKRRGSGACGFSDCGFKLGISDVSTIGPKWT